MAKHYVVLRRMHDNSITAYADASTSMRWSAHEAYVLTSVKDYEAKYMLKKGKGEKVPSHQKLKYIKSLRDYVSSIQRLHPKADIFLARVGANSCPVKVDLSSKGSKNSRILMK